MGLHSVQSLSQLHGCPRGKRAQCTCRLGPFSGFCCPAKNSLLGIFWRMRLRKSLEHEPKDGTVGRQGMHTLILPGNTKLFPNLRPFTPSCSRQHGWEMLSWSCQTCWFLPIWWDTRQCFIVVLFIRETVLSPSNQIASCLFSTMHTYFHCTVTAKASTSS